MSPATGTVPITLPRPHQRPVAVQRARTPARPSLARRRWGFAVAVLLMIGTLPVHLLGLALVALEVLSPSTDGSAPWFVGGVGAAQLLLLVGVASVGQLIGGGTDRWRRRMALASLNGVLVVAAAAVAWGLLLTGHA